MRIPPTVDGPTALAKLEEIVKKDPPYGAHVSLSGQLAGSGWCMKPLSEPLQNALDNASDAFYGKKAHSYGVGASIPFLCELGKMFPKTEIVALGVLGPGHNAHNPDENLHLPYIRKFMKCMVHILADLGVQQ